MRLKLNYIGGHLQEVSVDEVNSGTMNKQECVNFVVETLGILDDMLNNVGLDLSSNVVRNALDLVELEANDAT